jgi:hypothetical protein
MASTAERRNDRAARPQRLVPTRLPLLVAAIVMAAVATIRFPVPAAEDQQPAPASQPGEYTVKAVFLYSFGRFVQWPDSAFSNAADPLVIGIAGENPFGQALDEMAAKRTIQGRPIVIRRFASPDDYRPGCHMLFVSRSLTADQQAAFLKKTEGKPVLVIGETPGFAEKGGAINFFIEDDRVRFEINAEAARRAQLHLDAKLLNLGKAVAAPRPAAAR